MIHLTNSPTYDKQSASGSLEVCDVTFTDARDDRIYFERFLSSDEMIYLRRGELCLRVNGASHTLTFRGASLDLNDGSVACGDERAELTKNEFRILHTLLENRGKIVSRDALMLRLWNDDCFVEENTLTVNVTRLRRKLEGIGLRDVIVTKPGSGYLIP